MLFQCDNGPNTTDVNTSVPPLMCKDYPRFHWWVDVPVVGVLCVVGLVANILALVVWRSSSGHSHSMFLLQALAVTDNLYLLVTIFVYPVRCVFSQVELLFLQLAPLTYYLQNTTQSLCIWMIVLVTAERFVYVIRPMQASQLLRMHRKRCLLGLVYAFGLIYNLPYLLCYCVNGWKKRPRAGLDPDVLTVSYGIVSRLLFMYLIPLLGVSVMSAWLVRTISQSRRRRTLGSIYDSEKGEFTAAVGSGKRSSEGAKHTNTRSSHNSQDGKDQAVLYSSFTVSSTRQPLTLAASRNETRTTTLLVIIVVVFMVCQLPEMIYNVAYLQTIFTEFPPNSTNSTQKSDMFAYLERLDHLVPISNFTLAINSSANFFVYFLFGIHFRRQFLNMCRVNYQ